MRKIEPVASGRYKVRFRHGVSTRTGKPVQSSEVFDTLAAAERFTKVLDALGPEGALADLWDGERQADVPTMNDLAEAHIAALTGVEQGTRDRYRGIWSRTWAKHLGTTPANRVTRDHVAAAVNALGETYAHKSLSNQRGLLAGVCKRGIELGYMTTNPAKGIRLPRSRESERKEMRILTPSEFDQLADAIADHYRPFVRFLVGTGCRWGEAVALQVVDVAPPNIRIVRSLKADRTIGPPKTRKSRRTVMLPAATLTDVLHATEGKSGDALVFTAPRGGMIQHRTFWADIWLPAANTLAPRPRIHDLRHTHAAWLLAAGVPIHVVQARLGHESITTTVDTYGGLLPDAQVAAAAAADAVFGAPSRAALR